MNIILYGNDKERIQQKVDSFKKQFEVENVLDYDATAVEQEVILNEIDSLTIFDERKVIVIRQATFLSAKNTTNFEIEPFIKRSDENDQCVVIFCCPSEKLDGTKKLVKQLQSLSKVIPCMALDEKSLPSYLNECLEKHELRLERDAYQYVLKHIGFNPMRLENEVYKLKTYGNSLSLKDVQALIHPAPNEDIFKMVNALFEQEILLFLEYYRSFRQQGMEPLAIVALLASQIRFLYQVRVQMDAGYTQDEIASHLKAHPYRIKMTMQRAWNYSPQDLLDQLEELATFDQEMKKGLVDKDQGFEHWIFTRRMDI